MVSLERYSATSWLEFSSRPALNLLKVSTMISADMNNSMTYQNIIDGRKEFVAYSLQPFICAIEDRLSMDDITPRGHVVKFAIEESFLRADTMKRLEALEKMLALGLIDVEDAKEMESLTPNGRETEDETYIQ